MEKDTEGRHEGCLGAGSAGLPDVLDGRRASTGNPHGASLQYNMSQSVTVAMSDSLITFETFTIWRGNHMKKNILVIKACIGMQTLGGGHSGL